METVIVAIAAISKKKSGCGKNIYGFNRYV
jgi:hypothetical protein